ncbi:hypothetical protein [Anaerocolumna chitinilytica]|uniref:Uncharacterized protein n=1 Tax=Anaerocolumna chitinilytica TaxID=1727145 RepID=A0A7I8DR24_9FIRM|nr:hypothetical protein [Anaerocolumna chitinilytica]BCJ99711.1 hypothetical protein bsdcttw_27520 [Anaerocolumna chitinilytica]
MNYLKKGISIFLGLILFFTVPVNNIFAAADNNLLLKPYVDELAKINKEFGTNYTFPTEENLLKNGSSIQEMTNFYQNMSMDEFDAYIRGLYNTDNSIIKSVQNTIIAENNFTESNIVSSTSSSTSTSTQKYFYGGQYNSNYLKITSTISNVNGTTYIYSSVDQYGQYHGSYPYYDPSVGLTQTFSTDRTKVSCTFKCVKYLSAYVQDGVIYNISCTFGAGQGDIYASSPIS